MKRLLMSAALVAAIAAGAYLSPGWIEGASSPCGADAVMGWRAANGPPNPRAVAYIDAFGGLIVARTTHAKYPDVPPEIACAWTYWTHFTPAGFPGAVGG